MTKQTELKKSKRRALYLLCGATGIFVICLFLPAGPWRDGVKAVSEAAMVGAMADWFAVVALFRRVPIPFISTHTAIIPRNQNNIADNLAAFVHEKFFDDASITALLKKHDPAGIIAQWLTEPANGNQLGNIALQAARGFLAIAADTPIQEFFRRAVHGLMDKVDLSAGAGVLLDSLTKDGRHQALLDNGLKKLIRMLNKPVTRQYIAARIILWLKREHPLKEKLLPSEWLGEHGAQLAADALNSLLDEIEHDPHHELRRQLDRAMAKWIERLKQDPATAQKADELKHYLKNDPALNAYIGELWGDLLAWLKNDLARPQSLLHGKVAAAGAWLGETLAQDERLRASLNRHLENAARKMAPDFAAFLTRHISDTVKSWDQADMARQIELNIGRDLQYIRINGTLVGGFIGLALYLISLLPGLLLRGLA